MNEGITVLLWLGLIAALAIPLIWVAWVMIKRIRANDQPADTLPGDSEETTRQ